MDRGAQFKRGVVVLNDYARGRSRVRLEDEDGMQTFWLSWNMAGTSANKSYNAPDLGAQVNCLVDAGGEDGVILGARYSKQDGPPTQNGREIKHVLEGGLDYTYDKGSGLMKLICPGGVEITGPVKLTGNLDVNAGHIKNDGVPVDKTHGHVSAPPGLPGPPVGA
jgi:phage baseplate assembly protein gpV